MIALTSTSPTLERFARELDATSPRALSLAPDLSLGTDLDRAAAFLGWASRIIDEHRSVIVFTELLGLLATIQAPYPALAAVHRIIGDELRHTKLCADLASAFGPLDRLDIDLDDLGLPPRGDEPIGTRALRIVVRELVVGEGESIAVLRAYRDAATDPACKEALSLLLFDEARHHAAGRHLEALLLRTLPREDILAAGDLASIALADAAHIRANHRAAANGGPGRAFGVSIARAEAPPLAVPSAA